MSKLSILAVACLLATAVNAQFAGVPNHHMQVKLSTCPGPDNIQLWLYNLVNLRTTVTLVNEEGEIFYNNEVDDLAAWGERFHFEIITDGTYFFVVQQSGVEKHCTFKIKDKKVMLPGADAPLAEVSPRPKVAGPVLRN